MGLLRGDSLEDRVKELADRMDSLEIQVREMSMRILLLQAKFDKLIELLEVRGRG